MNIQAGQIWRLNHPHNRMPKVLATFTVLEVKNGYARVQGQNSVRRIRLDSFDRPGYYSLLKEAS